MRTLLSISVVVCLALSCVAGGIDKVTFALSSVSTSSTATEATSSAIKGWIERIDLKFSSSTNACDIDVIASNSLTSVQTTLYSVDAKTNAANISVYPRTAMIAYTNDAAFTNQATRFVVLDEVIFFKAANSLNAGHSVYGTIIYERP